MSSYQVAFRSAAITKPSPADGPVDVRVTFSGPQFDRTVKVLQRHLKALRSDSSLSAAVIESPIFAE